MTSKRLIAGTAAFLLWTLPACGVKRANAMPRPDDGPGTGAAPAAAGNVDLPRYPSVSPDGRTVVFSWRGDLWRVPAGGGAAERLTANPADEGRSAFTQDGAAIVFESDRDGWRNLWVMNVDGTGVRQLTALDTPVTLGGVGPDGSGGVVVTFDAARENDLFRSARAYQVPLGGGAPRRVHDAFGTHAVPLPDGSGVLFERGGSAWYRRGYRGSDQRDVWLFTPGTGAFTRLTEWEGNDGLALGLPGGDMLYLSDRDGKAVNVWRRRIAAPAAEGGTPLTTSTRDVRDLAVSADGSTAVLTCWDGLFSLDLRANPPAMRRLAVRATEDAADNREIRRVDKDVTEALLNPDGKSMAFVAYGDIFVRGLEDKAPVARVTETPAHERNIAWSPDGASLYFTTDRTGRDSIDRAVVRQTRSEVRRAYKDGTATPAAAPAATPAAAPAAGAAPAEKDDKPAHAADPGRWAEAITFELLPVVSGAEEMRQPDPSPDGRSLAYRRGPGTLVVRALADGSERVARAGWDPSIQWRWSPDGRWLAIQQQDRDFNSDIWVAPADGSAEAINVTRHPDADVDPCWSADGRVLAFRSDRTGDEFDVWMVSLDKSLDAMTRQELETYYKDAAEAAKKRKPLNAKGDAPRGKGERAKAAEPKADGAEAGDGGAPPAGAAADAKPEEETAEKPSRSEEKAAKPAKEAPVLSLDDAWRRVRRVTTMQGSEGNLEITPGGDRLIFTSSGPAEVDRDTPSRGGDGALMSCKWDGTDQKKLGGSGTVLQMSLTGDKVVLLREGRVSTVSPAGGAEPKAVDFSATTVVDRQARNRQKFLEAARRLGEGFYHPTMKGLDWAALTEQYLQLASAARTSEEFDMVANRMLGELNASHLGITSPASAPDRQALGRLGVTTAPVEGGLQVVSILPEGPAEKSPTPLRVDDVIVAVAGTPLDPRKTLEEHLRGRSGEETLVTVRRRLEGGAESTLQCLLVPCSAGEQADLAYKARRLRAASQVAEWSGGRLGYIHIQSMNQPSLDEFERDLYAAAEGCEGLIIDVRNNGGGWTADRLLSSIMAPAHAYTVPRGADPSYTLGYPRDRLFIQRYTLPINMLCNEKSFSNAEITAHAFKTLKRGTLVGQTTYGGVISTGGFRLLDGTSVRMPFRGWYLPDGTDMENHGAVPDLLVPQTPEDESKEWDAQLNAAVADLMKRVPGKGKRSTDP